MTGEEVLAFAASHDVRVTLELGDLRLEADHEPPAEALVALRDHKEAVVAELGRVAATAGEWCRIFEDRVATVMRAGSLPRPEAERAAYEIVLVESSTPPIPTRRPTAAPAPGAASPRRADGVRAMARAAADRSGRRARSGGDQAMTRSPAEPLSSPPTR
jgi:hypothetical protein